MDNVSATVRRAVVYGCCFLLVACGASPIKKAAVSKDYTALEKHLAGGEEVDNYWQASLTSTWDIVIGGEDYRAIELLAEYGHPIPDQGLQYAIKHNNLHMMPYLVEHGADVNALINYKLMPFSEALGLPFEMPTLAPALGSAVVLQDYEMAEMLLSLGAAAGFMMDYPLGDQYFSPVQMAVAMDDPRMLRILIDAGAPLNVIASRGLAPISLAAEQGDLGMVKMLADGGSYIAYNDDFPQPIDLARKHKHDDVVEYLYASGVPRPVQQRSAATSRNTATSGSASSGGNSSEFWSKAGEAVVAIVVITAGIALAVEASKYSSVDDLYLPPDYGRHSSSRGTRGSGSSSASTSEWRRPSSSASLYSDDGCSSDYQCGTAKACVKKYLRNTGQCMTKVDASGGRTFSGPSADSIGPRTTVQCLNSSDCPAGFACKSNYCVAF